MSAALVFLLVLFDVAVVQAASGNLMLLWSPLLTERLLRTRDLSAAATMLIVGLLVCLAAYAVFRVMSQALLWLVRRQSPSRLLFADARLTWAFRGVAIALFAWPTVAMSLRGIEQGIGAAEASALLRGSMLTVASTWLVGIGMAGLALAFVLAAYSNGQSFTRLRRATLIPVLTPEQAYVLVGVFLTASGAVMPSLGAVWVAQAVLCLPVAVFVCAGLISTHPPQGTIPFSRIFATRWWPLMAWGAAPFRRPLLATAAVCMWIVADDYLIAEFLASPGSQLSTPLIFQNTRRDVSPDDLGSIAIVASVRVLLILLPLFLLWRLGQSREAQVAGNRTMEVT